MKSAGLYIALFGIGSIILHFINMEFRLLSWIENWGSGVAWAIRAAMIVVGAAIWFLAPSGESEAPKANG
jgi:hypothetical protein